MLYENTDVHPRTWVNLKHPGDEIHPVGSTLSLAPQETVDLDLPEDFADVWLKPARRTSKHRSAPVTPEAAEPAEQKE